MKTFRIFMRGIRDAFKSVFRNFSLSLASISCITITLIIVAVSIMASMNVENFTKVIKEDVTMVVYIEYSTDQDGIDEIEEQIKRIDNVESYEFKSRESVKEDMSGESEVFNEIMGTWDESDNPLKDTFLVKVKDIEKIKETSAMIMDIENVVSTNYGESMVETLITSFKAIEKVAIGAVLALIIVTIFLIVNTIKITIFSRKREISIMRLVGASNFAIKNPFRIEGIILGIIGSIIPILITIYGYMFFYNHFGGQLWTPLIKLIHPEPFIYIVSLITLALGIFVGMIGSSSAVRKYLKV